MAVMSVLSYTQHLIAQQVKSGEIAIDATVGNGVDTCFLARVVGCDGYLYGFDIQAAAIEAARARTLNEGHQCQMKWICDGHQHMGKYVHPEHTGKVAAVMFNLGFLPGGEDTNVITQPDTTLSAAESALGMIRKGGIITFVLYPGHDGGAEEAEQVTDWARRLPGKSYDVIQYRTLNRIKQPPYLVAVSKK